MFKFVKFFDNFEKDPGFNKLDSLENTFNVINKMPLGSFSLYLWFTI
jgi:hypothetical protein